MNIVLPEDQRWSEEVLEQRDIQCMINRKKCLTSCMNVDEANDDDTTKTSEHIFDKIISELYYPFCMLLLLTEQRQIQII